MSQAGRGQAFYRQGELHRLRGDLAAAREAYRNASRNGFEPQPGLALLSLAAGEIDAAAAAIRRVVDETVDDLHRARLLPAYVEIMLAAHEIGDARAGCRELERRGAADHEDGLLDAIDEQARGAVELAEGDARRALISLRRARDLWHELDAPYEAARTRVLIGAACRELGDYDSAELELEAARDVLERLGAVLDVARVDALCLRVPRETAGLTERELHVLRLIAAGATNKAIAAELVVSKRTVDRHVSNIFRKLGVRSRAAATAYAFEHGLI
jgi:DNA-binding CsgD family transcriptional regulator